MNKINGYTEEEAKNLVEFIKEGKRKGKTLTYLFETYGLQRGRAKGSVRNYYYVLMKNEKGDERVARLLDGSQLSVEKIREFTEEETDEAIRSILTEKSKGLSVRKAIFNLAQGDDKLMLRMQNKYRNMLKKDPLRIAAIAAEMGLEEEAVNARRRAGLRVCREEKQRGGERKPTSRVLLPEKDALQRKLEREINALYDRLAKALKEENERLRAENAALKSAYQKRQGDE